MNIALDVINNLAIVFAIGMVFSIFEYIWPIDKKIIVPFRKESFQDTLWLLTSSFLPSLINAFIIWTYSFLLGFFFINLDALPFKKINLDNLFLQFVILLLSVDFLKYIFHVYFHRSIWWCSHMLHHSAEKIDWLTGQRGHWVEDWLLGTVLILPVSIFVFNPKVYYIFSIVQFMSGYINHANINISLGMLTPYIANPKVHRWHHSPTNFKKGGQNFGDLTLIWDHLFNTFYMPDHVSTPIVYGLFAGDRYPKSFFGRFFHPIIFLYNRAKGKLRTKFS